MNQLDLSDYHYNRETDKFVSTEHDHYNEPIHDPADPYELCLQQLRR
jgi:hypothetical protein